MTAARRIFDRVRTRIPHLRKPDLRPGLSFQETPMEIATHLVLSTGHIAATTAEQLDCWASIEPGSRPVSVATTDYGWFVSTYILHHVVAPLPGDLASILNLARDQGCAWILLDRDGETLAELPTFDW